ncbi:MAG: hypothetical protein MUF04_08665, partial [Akkermansiaceae bacterium]|nr:hypothetical protein [Akkermansiaceae bacterium]
MEHEPQPQQQAPSQPGLPDALANARREAAAAAMKKQAARMEMKRVFWFAGLACIVILLGIEALVRLPKPPPPPQAVARQVAPPVQAPPPAPVEPVVAPPEPAAAPEVARETPRAVPPPPADPEEAVIAPTEAELMAREPVLVLTGMDAGREAAKSRDKSLLKRAVEGPAWDAYRALLGRSIQAALPAIGQGRSTNRFDAVWDSPALYQALLRWKTLGWFSEADITAQVRDIYSAGMILWLLDNNAAMEELLLTMDPADDSSKVLAFLNDTWSVNPNNYEKYFPLALACAVVFDRPMDIPHAVASEKYQPESRVDPMKRYQWYLEKNEAGKLTAPVHRSSARDLVWVVCAPVCTAELDWAISNMSISRRHWGNAYGMVEYLMERAVEGENPYKEYSFEEILKHGGVCGDQTYFCVNTARAHGIPAMGLSGETDSGAHAWAALKVTADEWNTGIGRIGGASKGQAGNPQTGGSITEQEVQLWNDRHHRSPVITLAVFRHLWLADFFAATNKPDDQAATVRLANTIGRPFVETWHALYTVLQRQTRFVGQPPAPENLADWRDFASAMRREFRDNPRMAELAAKAESEYIFPYGPEAEARLALHRERRRIERDAGEQKDLIAVSLKREADLIAKRGGPDAWRDISRLYDRALRDYGGNLTGCKMMAEDYFGHMKADPDLARKAARDIELAFKRVVETGTKEWFRANAESDVYKMICGYY